MFTNSEGDFSGVVVSDLEDNLNNPSGANITLGIVSRSSSLTGASINSDGDLSISVKGLTANANANVVVSATGTVGGVVRTVEATINFRLVFNTVDLSGYVTTDEIEDFITIGDVPVTEGDIPSTAGFITIGDVPVTQGDIPSTAGFITIGDVPVTQGDIPSTAGFITIGDVPVTQGDIPSTAGFITCLLYTSPSPRDS